MSAADGSKCRMQNAKCRMIVSAKPTILIICVANTSILHFEFFILHFAHLREKPQFAMLAENGGGFGQSDEKT